MVDDDGRTALRHVYMQEVMSLPVPQQSSLPWVRQKKLPMQLIG
jgi:hypothetical protein